MNNSSRAIISTFMYFGLTFGIVDQVNDKLALVEYEESGILKYKNMNLEISDCIPREGQAVYFEGRKIVDCKDLWSPK